MWEGKSEVSEVLLHDREGTQALAACTRSVT